MGLSLPLVFGLQAAVVVGCLAGIIISFSIVVNRSVQNASDQAVIHSLEALRNQLDADVLYIEPLVWAFAMQVRSENEFCEDRRSLPHYRRHLADQLYTINQYPGIEYIYQSYVKPNGHWIDCGCGGGYCEYGDQSAAGLDVSYLVADSLPLNLTVIEINDRDATNDEYVVQIRGMQRATEQTGWWHPTSVFVDPSTGETPLLVTFSVPLRFDASNRTTSAFNIDLNMDWLRDVMTRRIVGGGFVYLVDARRDRIILHTLSFPPLQPDDRPWNATSTPDDSVNRAVRTASGGFGLNAQSEPTVFTQDEWIVSAVHLQSGTLHWVAFDHTPSDFYYGEARRLQRIIIGIAVLVVLLCVSIQVGVFLCVVRPLNEMSDSMEKISKLEDGAGSDAPPMLSELGSMYRAYNDLNKAMQSFTRYVPREVVKDLMMSGQLCEIKMRSMSCSILFVDIKGFTSICERVPVNKLSPLIGKYFDQMSDIVMHHNGIIDKFIGDCIMAVWGAPFPQEDCQLRAALCALRLHHATTVDPLKSDFTALNEELAVRVGVAHGRVLAGNMGTLKRMNYTVIGDSVNLAARLESLNKQFGTNVMVAENVASKCSDHLVLRLLHRVAVVGREDPVCVYEVMGARMDNPEDPLVASITHLQSEESFSYSSSQPVTPTAAAGRRVSIDQSWRKQYVAANSVGVETLIEEAKGLCHTTPEQEVFAHHFTIAVKCYLNKEFKAALRELNDLDSKTNAAFADHPSVERIVSECEEHLANPSLRFQGYFTATEK